MLAQLHENFCYQTANIHKSLPEEAEREREEQRREKGKRDELCWTERSDFSSGKVLRKHLLISIKPSLPPEALCDRQNGFCETGSTARSIFTLIYGQMIGGGYQFGHFNQTNSKFLVISIYVVSGLVDLAHRKWKETKESHKSFFCVVCGTCHREIRRAVSIGLTNLCTKQRGGQWNNELTSHPNTATSPLLFVNH